MGKIIKKYKYHALERIFFDSKTYNPGEIIWSDREIKDPRLAMIGGSEKTIETNAKTGDMGKVDIIFVRFNLKEIEDEAIRKVRGNTEYENYSITDVDNYQTRYELSYLWNRLIEKSDAEFVCLLNTDAFVTKGWLNEIMRAFQDKEVAAVGPSGDNVGGVQREIGTEEMAKNYRGSYKRCIGKDTLSGFCLVIRKSAWKSAGGFPEEVPFYGGEHAFLVACREEGYKLIWAQGAFVYHKSGASAKKEGNEKKLRDEGPRQYLDWLAKRVPILLLTYNRLEYTKKSLKRMVESTEKTKNEIIIFDNCSTDGTREWLKEIKDPRISVILNDRNIKVAGAMNEFFKMTKNKEYVAKVDNDTLVPDGWLDAMLMMAEHYKVDILQPKHFMLHSKFKSFDEWMETLKGDNRIRFSDYVGGSGILVRRAMINDLIPSSESPLGGWTQYQANHPELKKAFCRNVEIRLLDMKDDNEYDWKKYPDYYVEVGRMKREKREKPEFSHKTSFKTIEKILKETMLGNKFAYTRFGDGEIMMLDGWEGRKDYQLNSPELTREIRECLGINDKNFMISSMAGIKNEPGMEEGMLGRFGNDDDLQEILARHTGKREFYSPVAIHYLMIFYPAIFKAFMQEITARRIGFIGNEKIFKSLKEKISINDWVIIPETQAYGKINEYYGEIEKLGRRADMVFLAAGIASNAIQKRMWEDCNVSTIDLGSVADALAGISEKTWIKKSLSLKK